MLYREIIAVCSQIHTKHINTLCGQNVELLIVKPGLYEYYYCNIFRYGQCFKMTSLRSDLQGDTELSAMGLRAVCMTCCPTVEEQVPSFVTHPGPRLRRLLSLAAFPQLSISAWHSL